MTAFAGTSNARGRRILFVGGSLAYAFHEKIPNTIEAITTSAIKTTRVILDGL
jgi:hypothetical protein